MSRTAFVCKLVAILFRPQSAKMYEVTTTLEWKFQEAIITYNDDWLAPSRWGSNYKSMIFKRIILGTVTRIFFTSSEIALRWMSQNVTNDVSTLVYVMAPCCQTTSHYLSQCWPRSMLPYVASRLQWLKFIDITHLVLKTRKWKISDVTKTRKWKILDVIVCANDDNPSH